MTVIRCRTHIEAYQHKARSSHLHELSGRTGRPDLTAFINQHIIQVLALKPTDCLVDIGCGAGTLLQFAAPLIPNGKYIGLAPTPEEVKRLQATHSSTAQGTFQQGFAQRLPLPDACADKVVCNGVILLLPPDEVNSALEEIRRIAKPQALVWLGEIPQINELADRNYGDSLLHWLWWVLKHQGIAAFYRRARQTLRGLLTPEPLIISPKTLFYEPEAAFIARVQQTGLSLEYSRIHAEITPAGEPCLSTSRMDYLFRCPV